MTHAEESEKGGWRPPLPPDQGHKAPVETPPDQPGTPPGQKEPPPKGDPQPKEPTRL